MGDGPQKPGESQLTTWVLASQSDLATAGSTWSPELLRVASAPTESTGTFCSGPRSGLTLVGTGSRDP